MQELLHDCAMKQSSQGMLRDDTLWMSFQLGHLDLNLKKNPWELGVSEAFLWKRNRYIFDGEYDTKKTYSNIMQG